MVSPGGPEVEICMKKLLIWIAILTLVTLAVAGAETFYPNQVANCNEYVTLRASASSSADALTTVPLGNVVMAAPYNSEFSYCCYNGQFGYIKSYYLSTQIHTYSEGTFCVGNCGDWVPLKDMPLQDANVRGQIPLGARFDAVYYADGSYDPNAYAFVRYNGQYGWVQWKYVEYIAFEGAQ